MSLKEELERRGLLYQFTHDALFDLYNNGGKTFYFGCDPTAASLHLGNFVVFMNAVNFMKRGNKLILIVGGATGMIGDPGGRDSERTFLDEETLAHNVASIEKQVGGILENLAKLSGSDFSFEVINNKKFYEDMNFLDFLRDVGKHITVNQMIAKETVKKRIEDHDKSISYTEFSYMLLQGYDYVRLLQDKNVQLQISGSDQRGNIVTGIELIKKKLDKDAYGITSPLILDSNGKKFGKSMGNALWLDPTMTTPFTIYQYFMNCTDEDVERFLKLFTLLELDTIADIVTKHNENTAIRYGQSELAKYVTETIHGQEAMRIALKVTAFLFGDNKNTNDAHLAENDRMRIFTSLSDKDIEAIGAETGGIFAAHEGSSHGGSEISSSSIIDVVVGSGLETSRGNAKKAIDAGSIYVNEVKINDPHMILEKQVAINGYILLRKGKKNFKIVRIA